MGPGHREQSPRTGQARTPPTQQSHRPDGLGAALLSPGDLEQDLGEAGVGGRGRSGTPPPPEELSRRLPSGSQDVREQMCGWDVRVRAWVPRVGAEGRGPRRVRVRAGKEPRALVTLTAVSPWSR